MSQSVNIGEQENIKAGMFKKFKFRESALLLIIVIGFVLMSFMSDIFLNAQNLLSLLLGLSVPVIVAIGMTVVLISGGIDLSVGSIMAFSALIASLMLDRGTPIVLTIVAGLAAGAFFGFINGLIIAKLGVNPFITTLSSMIVIRGLVLLVSDGKGISSLPSGFAAIGQGKILGVQSPIWIMILLIIVFDILLRKHAFFRQNYYIGSNERAAIFSGFKVNKVKIFNYVFSGLFAAVSGILLTARLGSFSPTIGTNLELTVLAGVIIGGASLLGGAGTVFGAFLGCLFMAFISNSLNLLGISVYWQQMVMGLTLLIAVLVDIILNKKRK